MKNRDGPFFDNKENSMRPTISCLTGISNSSLSGASGQLSGIDVSRFLMVWRICRTQAIAFSIPQAREPHSKDELISVSASGWRITLYFFISLRLECYA